MFNFGKHIRELVAFSKSNWARSLPFLFFKGEYLGYLFSDCLYNDKNP